MAASNLKHSRALRALGQALEALSGTESFELKQRGNEYVVRYQPRDPGSERSPSKEFLARLVEEIWGETPAPVLEHGLPRSMQELRYTPTDIERLDSEGRSRRGTPHAAQGAVSQMLRALGSYLEEKQARSFTISWLGPTISVRYRTNSATTTDSFDVSVVHDMALAMHSRRAEI
ncbi:MAG TPA: hypothetical protein VNN77_10650 [candidate division Zixibacteria bacterium]|nr:hypothetical protein [candidate division Zixibacteria bacterium]